MLGYPGVWRRALWIPMAWHGLSRLALAADGSIPGGTPPLQVKIAWGPWILYALGPFYTAVFLALAITLAGLLAVNLISLRRQYLMPDEMVGRLAGLLRERQFDEARAVAGRHDAMFGAMMTAGLRTAQTNPDAALAAADEAARDDHMAAEHRLSLVALVGTISPMIGLLGTVHGMIASFIVIAGATRYSPRPSELAEGISTALLTTFVGLAIAIPAIAAHNLLRNRLGRLMLEVHAVADEMLRWTHKATPTRR